MMKFWFHKYNLTPVLALNSLTGKAPRPGALIRVQWPDGKIGFADCFPWPEFGDESLDEHLQGLSKGRMSKLIEQSIWLARRDAKLRALDLNALQEGQKVKSHYNVADYTAITDDKLSDLKSAGFSTLKIKVGRAWPEEILWITRVLRQHGFMARLDFNGSASMEILQSIGELPLWLKQKIEFVEDPFPYQYDLWLQASKLIPLAMDHEYEKVSWEAAGGALPFKVLVIKPARQDVDSLVGKAIGTGLKMVVTSSMDHPVGVAHATMVASELKSKHTTLVLDCGCLSNHLYMPNEFSTKMIIQGPYLTQIAGYGIGFDQVLGAIPWKPI